MLRPLLQLPLPLPLLLLLLPACRCQGDVESAVGLKDSWRTFTCSYDSTFDVMNQRELAVTVDQCTAPMPMTYQAAKFDFVAAVLGSVRSSNPEFQDQFYKGAPPPVYYYNRQNQLVKNGLVQVTAGGVKRIEVRVKYADETNGLCFFCGQSGLETGYAVVRKWRISIVSPPTVSAKFDSAPIQPNANKSIARGQSALLSCSGSGAPELTVRLRKDGKLLNSTGKSPRFAIVSATRNNAGTYSCQASSSMQVLKDSKKDTAEVKFQVYVKFAPESEMNEIVRYTNGKKEEDVVLTVSAYPEPKMTCDSSGGSAPRRQSLDPTQFSYTFTVRVDKVNELTKETRLTCTVSNSEGSRRISVLVTAKAPVPRITSENSTKWHNSYELQWEHHKNATVTQYIIRVVNLETNTTRTIKVSPMGKTNGDKLKHQRTLYNMSDSTQHSVSVQACNEHGCSDESTAAVFQTMEAGEGTYNDPNKRINTGGSGKTHGSQKGEAARAGTAVPLAFLLAALISRLT